MEWNSGYTFTQVHDRGDPGQCTSKIAAGKVIQFATHVDDDHKTWTMTSSTVQKESVILYVCLSRLYLQKRF